jgi:hypothetical protein
MKERFALLAGLVSHASGRGTERLAIEQRSACRKLASQPLDDGARTVGLFADLRDLK